MSAPIQEDWEAIWKRLRRFAHKYYYWLPARVRGVDLDDLVQEAILDTISGKRHLPPDVELVTFLCQVIRGKAYNLLKKKESSVVSLEEETPQRHLFLYAGARFMEYVKEADNRDVTQRLLHKLREFVNDDELESRILDQWLAQPDMKPNEMVKELEVSIVEIRKAQKRLGRKAKKLAEEWRNVRP